MTFHAATLTEIATGLNRDYIRDYGRGKELPIAFFITDQNASAQPEKIIATLPAGCAVIFRDYHHPDRRKLGQTLSTLCRQRKILFLVAGDERLATELQADGIHLPEALCRRAAEIRAAHPPWMITLSCHSLNTVRHAADLPVDAALIAPVFPTFSHPETYEDIQNTLGRAGVIAMVKQSSLPLFALGGIRPDNIHQLIGSGIAGIAAIRGFGRGFDGA